MEPHVTVAVITLHLLCITLTYGSLTDRTDGVSATSGAQSAAVAKPVEGTPKNLEKPDVGATAPKTEGLSKTSNMTKMSNVTKTESASKTAESAPKMTEDASKTIEGAPETSGAASKTKNTSKTTENISKTDGASKTTDGASKTTGGASKTTGDASETPESDSKTSESAVSTELGDIAPKKAGNATIEGHLGREHVAGQKSNLEARLASDHPSTAKPIVMNVSSSTAATTLKTLPPLVTKESSEAKSGGSHKKTVPKKGVSFDEDLAPLNVTSPLKTETISPQGSTVSADISVVSADNAVVSAKNAVVSPKSNGTKGKNATLPATAGNFTTIAMPITNKKPKKPTVTIGSEDEPEDLKLADKTPPKDKLLGSTHRTNTDYVVPIAAVILSVPLVAIVASVLYKRGSEWWQHRHYRRMDFLIDGMYNN